MHCGPPNHPATPQSLTSIRRNKSEQNKQKGHEKQTASQNARPQNKTNVTKIRTWRKTEKKSFCCLQKA